MAETSLRKSAPVRAQRTNATSAEGAPETTRLVSGWPSGMLVMDSQGTAEDGSAKSISSSLRRTGTTGMAGSSETVSSRRA